MPDTNSFIKGGAIREKSVEKAWKQRYFPVMRKRIDVEKIEKSVDFDNVAQELDAMIEIDGLKRRNTFAAILDRFRPQLLKARENRVPFTVLTQFLNERDIPVSEPTLRQYLKALPETPTPRKRRKARRKVATPEAAPEPSPESPKPTAESPPRSAAPAKKASRKSKKAATASAEWDQSVADEEKLQREALADLM